MKSPIGYKIVTSILVAIIILMTAFMAVTLSTNWFGKGAPEGWGGGTAQTPPQGGDDGDDDEKPDPDQGEDTKPTTYNISTVAQLTDAFNKAKAGDTLILAAGTYKLNSTQILSQSGLYNSYITVKAADNADVVLDFSEMAFDSSNRGIQIYGNYWYWYGIEIMGAGDNGMFIGGNYNIIENCEFHNNRDTGLQLGRSYGDYQDISQWPSYNYIKNCTSYNNYDNETKGENADGFAAKLTVGYGNVFDGCIAYRNSDDGWDLYAYASNGDIGAVIMYNCVAFENGFISETVAEFNAKVKTSELEGVLEDTDKYNYTTQNGDGNGFKLGGSVMRGNVKMYNCISFNNKMHGVTDNSNPGVLTIEGVTSYNNGAAIDTTPGSDTYGQVIGGASGDAVCNNIDVARSETSYNNLKNVLSIADSYGAPGKDAYRGSVTNSIFYAGGTTYQQFKEYDDAYSDVKGMNGTTMAAAPDSSKIFKALPYYTEVTGEGAEAKSVNRYNISGLENGDVHETYRNADNSINMKDILAIADSEAVFGTGATLNKTSWEDYTHFYDSDISKEASLQDSVLTAVYNTLYLYTDTNAVYQDFTLTTEMMGANITWKSSNEDILRIKKEYNSSNSGSQDVSVLVYRPEETTKVTLTATINFEGHLRTKTFELNIMADEPALGDVYVKGLEDAVTDTDKRFIIDQYQVFEEPELIVENAADYNGKTLNASNYKVETVYEYATSSTSAYSVVGNFSPSVAGVYRITKNVTFLGEPAGTTSYTYYIYVASNDAVIDFVEGTAQFSVNKDGYILSGDLTNVKGSINAYSSSDAAEIASIEGMTEAEAIAALKDKAQAVEFKDNSVKAQFTNDNSKAYTVFYWFENGAGEATSEVYAVDVSVETIASTAEFTQKLANNNASTVYLITADLDFRDVSYSPIKNLYGLINGNGHTISNLTVSGGARTGLFQYLSGGTIMNVKFSNVSLTATAQRVGLFGESDGGYISNVLLENFVVNAEDGRGGALIGQHLKGDLYIDNVALMNDAEHAVASDSKDLGGFIGLIQSSGAGTTFGVVQITDCMIDAIIDGANVDYVGGFVGRMEDRSVEDIFTMERCYNIADIRGGNYVGGMLGGQNNSAGGDYVVTMKDCIFLGSLTFSGAKLTQPEKNCSGIFGRFVETVIITIEGCVSNINEYGYESYVERIENRFAEDYTFCEDYAPDYDFENTWKYLGDENTDAEAPYMVLTFGGMFDEEAPQA